MQMSKCVCVYMYTHLAVARMYVQHVAEGTGRHLELTVSHSMTFDPHQCPESHLASPRMHVHSVPLKRRVSLFASDSRSRPTIFGKIRME